MQTKGCVFTFDCKCFGIKLLLHRRLGKGKYEKLITDSGGMAPPVASTGLTPKPVSAAASLRIQQSL